MEDLSPEAIVSYRFKQALRGYAIEEVDDLLDRLADQVERHLAEIAQLRDRLRTAEAASERTRETEATLQRTLVVAQQAAERNLADAAAQAEATVANATADAERMRREAEEESHRVRSEADADAQRARYEADAHAEQVRGEADAHAERVRSEADTEAARVRSEADEESTRVLEQAQRSARREIESARSRIEEATRRHAEIIAAIAEHRDALRANLTSLEELALTPPPAMPEEIEAGELEVHVSHADAWDRDPVVHVDHDDGPAEPWRQPLGDAGDDALAWPAPEVHGGDERSPRADQDLADMAPPTPLTVRVHDQHAEPEPHDAGFGSDGHDRG